MPEGELKKILIIRLSSIGDIVLTTPVIRLLRKKYPSAHIDYLTKPQFADLVRFDPHLDRVLTVPRRDHGTSLLAFRNELKSEKYDAIIDLHKNFRSLILSVRQNVKFISRLKKYQLRRFAFVKMGLNFYREIRPVYLRYIDVLNRLDIEPDTEGTQLFLSEHIEQNLASATANGKEIIALAPGAGFYTKRWPLENFIEVAHELSRKNYTCIVLGGKEDQPLGKAIVDSVPETMDFTGKLSLLESAAWLKKATRLITNDTGLLHIAEAVDTPVIALFGSTVKELGFFPHKKDSIVLENTALSCRPCTHIGREACPEKHFNCMRALSPDMVLQALKNQKLNANLEV